MLDVTGVEAFSDNYIWVIREQNGLAVVVDPGDEGPVIEYLQQAGLRPAAILITHKHGDHVGGIDGLKSCYPGLKAFGPEGERIAGLDIKLKEGDVAEIPDMGFQPRVLGVPGHTEGHIAYYGAGSLFCGDTLFACGCGRVFSGTMSQLYASLERIAQLPVDTRVYCAHEYTLDNIGFARWVEPTNPDLLDREKQVIKAREQRQPTVPSLLSLELATNPFLRHGVAEVKVAAERHAGHTLDNAELVFSELRQWKDKEYD